uniref:Uncharacterized protein n=1 Tax=Leersia perrieri TaxID=77586 RepID=A0A0D9Y068_9ORYZ
MLSRCPLKSEENNTPMFDSDPLVSSQRTHTDTHTARRARDDEAVNPRPIVSRATTDDHVAALLPVVVASAAYGHLPRQHQEFLIIFPHGAN